MYLFVSIMYEYPSIRHMLGKIFFGGTSQSLKIMRLVHNLD